MSLISFRLAAVGLRSAAKKLSSCSSCSGVTRVLFLFSFVAGGSPVSSTVVVEVLAAPGDDEIGDGVGETSSARGNFNESFSGKEEA